MIPPILDSITLQSPAWSWSQNSRLGLSRQSIGLGLDRIFKSRPVLVLVSFETLFQDMSWSWSCLKISFKRSLGIGLERQSDYLPALQARFHLIADELHFKHRSDFRRTSYLLDIQKWAGC